MSYYVWYDDEGNVISYLQHGATQSPFAIEVNEEEFKALGLYSQESLPSEQSSTSLIEEEVRSIINGL